MVPGAGNPQAFNRYSYVSNNPMKHVDPTGHMMTCADSGMVGGCGDNSNTFTPGQTQALAQQLYYNYYRPCQEHGREGCSGLATAIMNTVETIDSFCPKNGWMCERCAHGLTA